MRWLEIIAREHQEYLNIVRSFGEKFYAEDVVQEAYLRLTKYGKVECLLKGGKVNMPYMYFLLRNTYLIFKNKHEKDFNCDLNSFVGLKSIEGDMEKHDAYLKIMYKIKKETETWHWYDRLLFEIYRESGKSIRQLSKETNISVKSIFQTLKHCKQRIKENVGEDYTDYKNKEYELIIE